ncbi:MAG: SusC/RagA family TonB-linked outer membrane protein [Bacteroidales bacterium]|jgi:iron complex outermembrane receptor protein|nr:SusC/RagA family TonB-linked outer membrane protein [Bacteroidales bacterium]
MKNFRPKLKFLALLITGTLYCTLSFAQIKIEGRVTDSSGQPVIEASVTIKGTSQGTATDLNGAFTISAPSINTVLRISSVGYKAVEIPAGSPKLKNIVLEMDTELLSDVVVIGYGTVKKKDVTGSVSAIKNEHLNKGLQISAVDVVSTSGAPGSGSTIRIRSGASLSASNDPLIVIDGVPIDNSSINGSDNIIGLMNPNDIETFTVLKDASATAIYGSRASNGVILITTRKGTSGKPKITYDGKYSVSTITDYYDVLNTSDFKKTFNTYANAPSDFSLGAFSTDWQKQIYRTAFGHDHNLSVSGSLKNIPYRISAGYTDQSGIIETNAYKRYGANISLTPKFLKDHLSLELNLKGSLENNDEVNGSVVSDAMQFDPTRPVNETYEGNIGLGYFTWMSGGVPIAIAPNNPVAEINLLSLNNKIKRSIGNISGKYKIHGLEDLSVNMNLGYDILKSDYDETAPGLSPYMYTTNQKDGTGLKYNSVQKKRNTVFDFYTA